jgi:hypothetical protein
LISEKHINQKSISGFLNKPVSIKKSAKEMFGKAVVHSEEEKGTVVSIEF